jgi:hypothetical protein
MKIYIIRQRGVYWHEIFDLLICKETAIKRCKELSEIDIDDYHEWVVTEHGVGVSKCELSSEWRENKFSGGLMYKDSEVEVFTCRKKDE